MTRNLRTLPLVLAVLLCAAAPAEAAKRFTIRGAGFGHGVGMSQYGAMGYASHGWDYKRILGHYYTDTSIGVLDEPRTVRVLLQSVNGTASFTGASRASGRKLTRTATYLVRGRAGGQVQLLTRRGREIATFGQPLRVTGPGPVTRSGATNVATSRPPRVRSWTCPPARPRTEYVADGESLRPPARDAPLNDADPVTDWISTRTVRGSSSTPSSVSV